MMEVLDSLLGNTSSLWVFGYGSILWKTGFKFERKKIGYITGYARRFWQGSTSHRGTPQNPGRVATLIPANKPINGEEGSNEKHDGKVWGAAYELVGRDMIVDALDNLGVRECLLGGYISVMTPFHERPSEDDPDPAQISVLMFTATEANEMYLGPAPSMEALASQVISCRGPCGHNIQYVMRLADYMRANIPEERDTHLYRLVASIEEQLERRGLDMDKLIDDAHANPPCVISVCCSKCNAICSEYAFCKECRADTIKDALTCGPMPTSTSDARSVNVSINTPKLHTSPTVRRKRTPSLRESENIRRTEITVASQ